MNWAISDQVVVVNLCNPAFFNLNGEGSGGIGGHVLMINADWYTPVDAVLVPSGKADEVEGTPFDFRVPVAIDSRLGFKDVQLGFGKGYDHNFVLRDSGLDHLAARVVGDLSGVVMEVFTTEPGLLFYGGNLMEGKHSLRKGMDDFRTAFCLEARRFWDSQNRPAFPSVVLRPGEAYQSTSVYRFGLVD